MTVLRTPALRWTIGFQCQCHHHCLDRVPIHLPHARPLWSVMILMCHPLPRKIIFHRSTVVMCVTSVLGTLHMRELLRRTDRTWTEALTTTETEQQWMSTHQPDSLIREEVHHLGAFHLRLPVIADGTFIYHAHRPRRRGMRYTLVREGILQLIGTHLTGGGIGTEPLLLVQLVVPKMINVRHGGMRDHPSIETIRTGSTTDEMCGTSVIATATVNAKETGTEPEKEKGIDGSLPRPHGRLARA